MCEEYGCMPTRALWELENDPDQLALRIITFRDFIRTTDAIDAAVKADKQDQVPTGPMAELVLEIESEVTREDTERAIAERLAELDKVDDGGEGA
jgi:hypothetical protein